MALTEDFKFKNSIVVDKGINLIPPKSVDEIKFETKKSSFNISGALAILLFVVFTIIIFGYNIITKMELNTSKQKLVETNTELVQYNDYILKNEDILRKIRIFSAVQKSIVSYNEIFGYWQEVADGKVKINSIRLTSSLDFDIAGSSASLIDVAKVWHLLSTDKKLLDVNLKSLSLTDDAQITFEFEGQLDYNYFLTNALNNDGQ